MQLTFLGGAREVGRSAVLIKTAGGARILLDYGVAMNDRVHFPGHIAPKDIDAVFLTHAHLDHSGAIPMLFISGKPKLYATRATYLQAEILLKDMLKLSGYYLPFGEAEIRKTMISGTSINYGEPVRIKDAEIEFISAGHIPGSSQVIINADKTLLYTGDFTTIDTRLIKGSDIPGEDFDIVVTESTYAREAHPPRKELEEKITNHVIETVNNGGLVVIPAFSIARSQEVACILYSRGYRGPMYMDGMATQVLELYINSEEFIDGLDLLSRVYKKLRIVRGRRQREKAQRDAGTVITPAGMLKGGPAIYYTSKVADDPASTIILVSFQLPGSPGDTLLKERKLFVDGRVIQVKAQIYQYKLSAHAGMEELHEYISRVAKNAQVFTIHGEPESCTEFADWINNNTSSKAYAPLNGETIEV
ncbi:MAG: MBL fold metallo-hydrolase [Nitrososphaerota archaeon]